MYFIPYFEKNSLGEPSQIKIIYKKKNYMLYNDFVVNSFQRYHQTFLKHKAWLNSFKHVFGGTVFKKFSGESPSTLYLHVPLDEVTDNR